MCFELFACEPVRHHLIHAYHYSFLSFRQVHLWYDLKMAAGLRTWFVLLPVGNRVGVFGPLCGIQTLMAVSSHGGIPLKTYNIFRV